jgi:Type IX secretion system protein PorV
MKKLLLGLGISLGLVAQAEAQNSARRTLLTSVPFMTISPDARSASMGDAGVGSSVYDANALYWNAAKLAFADKKVGASLSVTPWLRNITDDMAVIGLSGYQKLEKNLIVGLMMGYFNSGSIQFTTPLGQPLNTFDSREFYMTGSIARKLSNHLSTGVNLKYINSNLTGNNAINNVSYNPGRSVAGDLNLFYTKDYRKKNAYKGSEFNFGATLNNIGTKISYGAGKKNFLPTSLKLGLGYTFHADEHNKFNFLADLTKLLVPSEPIRNAQNVIIKGTDPDSKTVVAALVSSFGDSPDGFTGEVREVNIGGGAEYWYNDVFAVRGGYYFQPAYSGGLKYYTVGIGARVKESLGVDFAYLIPSTSGQSPLSNTLRISLVYDVASKKKSKKATPIEEATTDKTNE